jgi:catechol 2,3-dioxygenase-like lactoylglutathione lyase family enzyme
MNDNAPDLRQLNLVVADMPASLDFYRRLGVAVPDGEDAAGPHVELSMPGGLSLELDTGESVGLWHAGFRADPAHATAFRLRHALRLLDDPGDPAVLGTIEEHLAHL